MTWRQKVKLLFLAAKGDKNACSVFRWRLKNPDHVLYDHVLSAGAVVYDVGGYRGEWTAAMSEQHACDYWVFEPHPEAFALLRSRFLAKPDIHLVEAALGRGSGRVVLSSEHEGSSIVKGSSSDAIDVRLIDASEFIRMHEHRVALMKLNIEGAEYDLVEGLVESGVIKHVNSFLVQFHAGAPEAYRRYKELYVRLSENFLLQWRYPFLWELWRRPCTKGSG